MINFRPEKRLHLIVILVMAISSGTCSAERPSNAGSTNGAAEFAAAWIKRPVDHPAPQTQIIEDGEWVTETPSQASIDLERQQASRRDRPAEGHR